MWKMLDIMDMPSSDADIFMFECDDCAGGMMPMPLAPPPQFLIPPPPRPPALAEYTVVPQDCNDEQLAQQQWDSDVCQAMPILDASLYSSQSLATSAMIAVFSLLLVLIVLISSLFVWKNKRKVQNLLPCKTPTRGPLTGALPLGGGGTLGSAHHHHHHHGLYEDPDAHLGHHRPLVMHRHHHHHHQQLPHHHHHYQQHHSELLQGKSIHYPSGYPMTRSPPFLVSSSPGPDPYRSNDNVYEELGPGRVDSDGESEPPLHSDDDFAEDELSLPGECSFQKEPATGTAAAAGTGVPANPGATPYHERAGGSGTQGAGQGTSCSLLQQAPQERHSVLSSGSSTGQDASTATASSGAGSTHNNNNNSELLLARRTPRTRQQRAQEQDLNNSTSTAEIADLAPLYDNRSNLMSLGYMARSTAPQFYNTLEHEVERRNRINAQLSKAPVPPLSTIYRERIRYPTASQQYPSNSASGLMAATMRARTQPRIVDRRLAAHQHQHHRIHAAPMHQEPAYGYAEPMYNANYYYESAANQQARAVPYATTGEYRHAYGDSSFGSDSGYSHHTPASSIGRQDYDLAEPQHQQQQPKQPSKLSSALSFGWNRGRGKASPMMVVAAGTTASGSSSAEATSPNNNSSACSTVTSQLDNNNAASLSPA